MNKLGFEAKRGGMTIPSKQKIYSKIAQRSDEIIDEVFKLSKSKNESIKLGAMKLLLNKIVPDLKSVESPVEEEEVEYEISDGLSSIMRKLCDEDLKKDYQLLRDEFEKRTGVEASKILEELKKENSVGKIYG